MKYIATLYSILFVSVTGWAWFTYFAYKNIPGEHMLPSFALALLSFPSSLLIEKIVIMNSWLQTKPAFILAMISVLGLFQVLLVWLSTWYLSI